jgi:hypothetical protein
MKQPLRSAACADGRTIGKGYSADRSDEWTAIRSLFLQHLPGYPLPELRVAGWPSQATEKAAVEKVALDQRVD